MTTATATIIGGSRGAEAGPDRRQGGESGHSDECQGGRNGCGRPEN